MVFHTGIELGMNNISLWFWTLVTLRTVNKSASYSRVVPGGVDKELR